MKIQILLIAFLLSQTLHAQWEELPMPQGGNIQFMGTAHNRVWVTCSNQNFYSDDQGTSWQRWALQDTMEFIKMWISEESLMAVAKRPSIVNLNLNKETIFESLDNGGHWQPVFTDTLHEYRISNAFSAGGYLFFVSTHASGWGQFLYRSSDHGSSWQNVDVTGNGTMEIQLTSANFSGNLILADMTGQDAIGSTLKYQLKSYDFGQTWQSVALPYFQGQNQVEVKKNCWLVKKRAYNSNSAIYWSLDDGNTFSLIPPSPCHNQYFIVPPSTLYAYDSNATGCLYTWDATQHIWQAQSTPPDAFIFLAQTENGVLLTGHYGTAGVWRRPSLSGSWSAANNGLRNTLFNHFLAHNNYLHLRNNSKLYSSQDDCQTWSEHEFSGDCYQTPYAWGDTLLTANENFISMSTDEGVSWTLFHTVENDFISKFRDFKSYGDTLYTSFIYYYGEYRVAILYTFDRGTTWHIIPFTPYAPNNQTNDFYPFQWKIWATMENLGDVFVSQDEGETWNYAGVSNFRGSIIGEAEHLFLYGNKLYYSPDAGESWLIPSGIPMGFNLNNKIIINQGSWFGLIEGQGIYLSKDFGATWTLFDPPGYPDIFDIFPADNYLYANRYPSGLWRRSVISTETSSPGALQSVLKLWPNPAHQTVMISWPENLPNETSFQVYDQYGRVVLQGKKQATPQTNLDISRWPSGLYMVKAGKFISKLVKN